MAYGLYLYKNVTTKGGRVVRLEIWSKDYTGSSAEIEAMGASPFAMSIDNSGGGVEEPLIKTNLNIVIKDTNQIDYDLFFTPDATKFKVIIKISGVDYWVGYLTPDSYSESLSYRSDIVLTARDNLGMLSEIKYERAGKRATMRTLLNEAMALISFGNTLEYRQKKTSGTLNILDAYIRCDRFIGKTWADVVQTILHDCGLQMRFVGAAKYAIYDIGEIVNLGTTISTQTFKFIEESGQREIIPAARTITLNQDYGSVDNSYDGVLADSEYSFRAARSVSQPVTKDISTPQVFTINYYDPFSIVWSGAGGSMGIVNPNEWNEAPSTIMLTGDLYTFTNYRPAIYYSQIMPITAGNVEVKFQVSNLVKYPATSGSDYVWKDYFFEYIKDPSSALVEWFGAKYQVKFRCNIFLQGATKTYIMRERWEEYIDEGPTATAKYLTFVLPSGGNAGEFPNLWEYNAKDEELKFNIQTIPEDGTLRIAFYPYELIGQFVQMYPSVEPQDIKDNIPLTYPILVKNISIKYPAFEVGGLESSAVINSAHNVAYNIDLELGQVPQGIGDSATMYGGLFNTGVNFYKALGNFFVTAGTEYHLSELIGREVANIYKEQREKLSGTIITDVNFSAMPSFGKTFTDGVKYYAINSGTLDFISEQMQVEMIEVEPYLYEDFTFVEATIESGGGSSMGAGEKTFVQWSAAGNAKRIYQLDTASEADQAGAFVFIDKSGLSAAKKVPISSLLVDAYTKTESDSRFASIDGDLTQDFSAKKLTTTTLLLPQTAPILASGEVGIYSLDSGFSGELPSGSGSVTSIALTMPTGFSVSGSPITESGTFGVTFASGYFLPTTTQFATKADVSLIGAANGIAPLDSGGKVALQYLPNTLLKYMGVWNASTNTPTLLATDVNRKGQVWNVSVAGTQFGIAFKLGDWLIYNDSGVAEKSDNSDDVTSVNGYTGAVTLKTSDIAEQTNLYYTDGRVKAYSDLNYLGISAKAADSDKLDGNDSTYFATATQMNAANLTSGYLPYWNGSSLVNSKISQNTTGLLVTGSLGSTGSVDILIVKGGTSSYSGELVMRSYYAPTARNFALQVKDKDGNHRTMILQPDGGNVGIGYTAKSEKFAVNGSGYFNTTLQVAGITSLTNTTQSTAYTNGGLVLSGGLGIAKDLFSNGKGSFKTLIIPQVAPTLSSGEMAVYGLESGFSGELPSGAGSVTSISMVVPTGLSVTPATITKSGTFTISYASGYSIPTNTKQSEWDNAYTLRHNAVTLGTANGLSLSTQVLSLGLASASTNGALSSTDWNTFNGKAAGDHNHNGTYALISGSTNYIQNSGALQSGEFWLSKDGKIAKFQNVNSGSYVEADFLNDASKSLTLGVVGSTYSNADWAGSSYVYNSGQTHFWLKSTGDIGLFTGGLTLAHKRLTIDSSGAATFSSTVSAASFTSGGNAVLHAGNYSSYALPLSGGTLKGNTHYNYLYARSIYGVTGADGDVHIGSSGNGAPTNGTQDYGFYIGYNAYRHTDGLWYHSRPTTVSAFVFKGGYHNGGFSWDFANNNGTSPITFTRLMHLSSLGVLTLGANAVLHAGNYSSYALPLSGGVINSTSNIPLTINTTNPANFLMLTIGGVTKALLSYRSTFGAHIQNATSPYGTIGILDDTTPYYSPNDGTTKHTLIHAGNSNLTTIDWSAKNLTLNGSISGATTGSFSGNVSAASFTSGGNAVIHSGNIGSQSVNYAASAGVWNGLNFNGLSNRFDGDVNTLGLAGTSGIYNMGGSHTNSPAGNLYGTLFAFWNIDISTQFWVTYNGQFYWRKSNGLSYSGTTWRTIWDSGNLTNALSSGYLPYWNGSSLANSVITQTSGNLNLGSGTVTLTENINTNLRIPKVAPTNPTSGEYYFYIVE